MPSGATHDRITLWGLPLVTVVALGVTRSSAFTLLVAGGYLFGGLMLSPDLDLRSRPYLRWGWLRWMWIPYQKTMKHRSVWTHGAIVGTTLRVFYLLGCVAIAALLIWLIVELISEPQWNLHTLMQEAGRVLFRYPWHGLALVVGLELGALVHSLSDEIGSAYKRYQKHGWQGLKPKSKGKKRPRRPRK